MTEAELKKEIEQLNHTQLTRFVKFLQVLHAGGTYEEAFTEAEKM